MKLVSLAARNYRSLRDVQIDLNDLNLFIGANASGKSTVLDALRFLHEAVKARDFRSPVFARGGVLHLAWKGEDAGQVELDLRLKEADKTYEWSLRLIRQGYEFYVEERIHELPPQSPPIQMLEAREGEGWWWSGSKDEKVLLKQSSTVCALAAAEADASFPARDVAGFIGRWGFFDPSPFLLRRDWTGMEPGRFDPYGRNLGETLHGLSEDVRSEVVRATQAIVGLPHKIETRESEDRCYFVQEEPGLRFPVHQIGVSSGTLRMLALMTALLTKPQANLIGIEEPENYVHPTALSSFAEFLTGATGRVQFMVTTHSPLLLDFLDKPTAIHIVQRGENGTTVTREENAEGIRRALDESGFGLGEFYQTKGFGAAGRAVA